MALGFAPFHYWPVIFISLPTLYLILQTATTRWQAIWRSFFFGYGYFMAGTWWIANALLVDADKFAWLLPFSVLGLSAVMALWFAVLGLLAYALRRRMSPLLFALLWLALELLRSLGMFGFPWNLIGYMSLASLTFAQAASVIGVYGLSFIIVWVGLLPIYYGVSRSRLLAASICTVLIVVGCYVYGASRLSNPTKFTDIQLRIVQPNIPQEVKGTQEGREVAVEALERLTELPATNAKPDVIIWPETAYPFVLHNDMRHGVPKLDLLITGAVRVDGKQIWNSILTINGNGEVLASYDKHQLVPFGEFVPLRSILPLDKITPGNIDFSRGSGPQTLRVDTLPPFSPLVCYEVIFPWMAIDKAARPSWLLNVTNDAWYGDSPGPYQHFEMARMRAIEQRLPLIRSANSGISAVIDSRGRAVSILPLGIEGILDVALPSADK